MRMIASASYGFGERTACHLAGLGARVVFGARRVDRSETIVAEIRAAKGRGGLCPDRRHQPRSGQCAGGLVASTFGWLDVIVKNAGLTAIATPEAGRLKEWKAIIDTRVVYGISAALPIFCAQNSGHFVNTALVGGIKVSSRCGVAYSRTKFAVHAISEGLRIDAGPNIRTTTISSGAVDSELKSGSSDPQAATAIVEFYKTAIRTQNIAFAISQLANVNMSDFVLRPTSQEL